MQLGHIVPFLDFAPILWIIPMIYADLGLAYVAANRMSGRVDAFLLLLMANDHCLISSSLL